MPQIKLNGALATRGFANGKESAKKLSPLRGVFQLVKKKRSAGAGK